MSIEIRSNKFTSMLFGQILTYSCTCVNIYNVNVSLPLVLPWLKTLDANGLFWGILKEETFSKKLMRYVISTSHKGMKILSLYKGVWKKILNDSWSDIQFFLCSTIKLEEEFIAAYQKSPVAIYFRANYFFWLEMSVFANTEVMPGKTC